MCFAMMCSCLGSACMGCCCSGLKDCEAKHGPASRVGYIFFMFVMCIYAVIMTLYGDTEIYSNDLLDIDFVVCDPDDNEACQANGSVYRVSFCLAIFFIIHFLVIRCSFASFHWKFLTWKLFTFFAILVITYFIPNALFDGYANFARIASFFFLLLQVLILISWAYELSNVQTLFFLFFFCLTNKTNTTNKKYANSQVGVVDVYSYTFSLALFIHHFNTIIFLS